MQNLNEESQGLMLANQQIITPLQIKPNHTDPFICGICTNISSHPVISQCGHLFCWKCIVHQVQQFHVLICVICHEHMQIKQMRPIYISGQQHHGHINTRPKPTNLQPIRNPSGFILQQTQSQHLRNNIQIGVQIAGYTPMPATAVLAFSNFDQNLSNLNSDQKQVTYITNKLQKCLIISFVFVILGILFISGKV